MGRGREGSSSRAARHSNGRLVLGQVTVRSLIREPRQWTVGEECVG